MTYNKMFEITLNNNDNFPDQLLVRMFFNEKLNREFTCHVELKDNIATHQYVVRSIKRLKPLIPRNRSSSISIIPFMISVPVGEIAMPYLTAFDTTQVTGA